MPTRTLRLLTVSVLLFAATLAGPSLLLMAQRPAPNVSRAGDLLDINTATPQQLKSLPGFGDAYVRRVIAGRPYTAKNQLVTRGVLPQSAYDRVSPRIVAHRPSR